MFGCDWSHVTPKRGLEGTDVRKIYVCSLRFSVAAVYALACSDYLAIDCQVIRYITNRITASFTHSSNEQSA